MPGIPRKCEQLVEYLIMENIFQRQSTNMQGSIDVIGVCAFERKMLVNDRFMLMMKVPTYGHFAMHNPFENLLELSYLFKWIYMFCDLKWLDSKMMTSTNEANEDAKVH